MIDIKNWKEFCLGDLFDIKKGTGFGLKNLPEGSTPLISATTKNNSIVAYTDVEPIFPSNTITVTTDGAGMGYATVQTEAFDIASNAVALIPKNNNVGLYAKFFICSVIRQYANRFSYKDKMNRGQLLQLLIKLPVTSDGQPDWDYMEFYMKKVMEETEEYIRIVGGRSFEKHPVDVSKWGEFKLEDLFIKRTMKGYPKKVESYDEVENGYHIFGQNIGYQYSYKVLMDEQYLHVVEPNKPILAYTSSVGEIGLINESFYRSGDNGAFQGLFPIGYHPNLFQMQFVLCILKKEFEKFRYDTSMQDTMKIKFKLPITPSGEPAWQYMEEYMKGVMKEQEKVVERLGKEIA